MQTSNKRVNVSKVKKVIIKKLSFLPYVDYVPDVKPKEPGLILLDELQRYENIVETRFNNNVQTTNELMEVLI